MNHLYDKRGIPIERGDILKVFHFRTRNKKYWMYKQALGTRCFKTGQPYMRLSHLNLSEEEYFECCDGRSLPDYEIVQGVDVDFTERPRRPAEGERK